MSPFVVVVVAIVSVGPVVIGGDGGVDVQVGVTVTPRTTGDLLDTTGLVGLGVDSSGIDRLLLLLLVLLLLLLLLFGLSKVTVL